MMHSVNKPPWQGPVQPVQGNPRLFGPTLAPSASPQLREQQQPYIDTEGKAVLLWWQGKRTSVVRDFNGLLLEQRQQSSCLPCCSKQSSASVQYVPYSEILCCRYLPVRRYCSSFTPCQRKLHYLELQVLQRHPSKPWQWSIRKLELAAEEPELVKQLVQQLQQQLRQLTYRPQHLLVFVNPYGGKRRARRTWSKLVQPILAAAGVACQVVETEYQGHAEHVVGQLSVEQLQQLDGLVAVGGDGLFSELLTAVLQHRHLAAALQLRLGHIPAGSTDAVACTLHGTRDAITAALHIALGDCTALDVGRMVTLPPPAATAAPAPAPAGLASPAEPPTASAVTVASPAAANGDAGTGPGTAGLEAAPAHLSSALYPGASVGSHTELLLGGPGGLEDLSGSKGLSSSGSAAANAARASRLTGQQSMGNSHTQSSSDMQQQRRQRKQRWQQRNRQQQQQHLQQEQAQEQEQVQVQVPQLRHFVCVANYGFLGDVMEMSERLRWCGPIRYDIAGALRFLLLRKYKATVWYKPAPVSMGDDAASQQQHLHDDAMALVSTAAVSPLPHHMQPALHARLAPGGTHLWPPPPQHQPQKQQQPACNSSGSSHCSSESSSRRSSLDFSGPLLSLPEGVVVGDSAAVPVTPLADAADAATTAAGSAGGAAAAARVSNSNTSELQLPLQQQQQGHKTVSFRPQVAAVHASAESASSRCSTSTAVSGAAAGAGAAALPPASRASSMTSSPSRCHSRCSRCSAVAVHRSSSRQSFAASLAAADSEQAATGPQSGRAHSGDGSSSSSLSVASCNGTATVKADADATASAAVASGPGADAAEALPVGSPPGPGWVKIEGKFASIMCVVTSCISDKSRQGLMPEAHLADGRLALVLVESCSRLQYLRFLLQLASKGIVPGSLPFVRVEYTTDVQVETQGRQSSWNVDGELLKHGRVKVGIHAGLVDVFARGVELM